MQTPTLTTSTASPLWRNRDFRLLFAAQIVSLLGSGVTTVGLALFAYQLVGGQSATTVVGTALMLRIGAFLLFSQPAGVLADRVNRKHILIGADLARFALLCLFPFVTQVWQVYVLIFLINAVTAFFTPTYEASIPDVVGPEQYVKALSLSRVAVDIEAFAAPTLAGLLVAIVGVRWVFWFDAFTYLVSAALVLAANLPHVKRAAAALSFRNLLSEVTHGTRILLREPAMRQALLLSMAEATAGAAAIVATVVYVRDVLGRGDTAFAVAMAALGLGSALAAFLLGRVTGRYEQNVTAAGDLPLNLHGARHRWSRLALLAAGIVLGLILLPGMFKPPLLLFVVLWALNGAGQSLISIASGTLLAEHTRPGDRGRAYAAYFALTHACWLITYPAIGYAASSFGAPLTFTAAGVACLATVCFVALTGHMSVLPHTHAEPDNSPDSSLEPGVTS